MLTLKKPIQLHIGQPLPTVSEELYERITGNYGLLRMHIAPKELLFFLSNPPELPEDLGGITSLSFQNTSVDNRAVTMDVVNNVVNRILLSDQQSFTYQDSVYLQTVLNKLGVTDVALFMREVRNLKDEHHSVSELISLYNQELKLREKAAPAVEGQASPPPPVPAAGELRTERTAWFLQNAIYQRLHTAEIYETVHTFQREQTQNTYRNSELRTAEQLAASRFLTLRELRERAVPGGGATLLHSVNHFELGDILPPPRTETQVLSQAATAALLATVEHVLVQEQTNRQERTDSHWLSLETALFETTQNTILRFQSQHDSETVHSNHWDAGESRTLTALHEEREILRELIDTRRMQTVLQTRTDSRLTKQLTLEQRSPGEIEMDLPADIEQSTLLHDTTAEKQTEILERSLRVERERHFEETLHTLSPGTEAVVRTEQPLSLTYASTTVEPGTAQETMERTGETREITALTRELLEHTTPPLPVQTVDSSKESAVLERSFRVERERHSEEILHTLSPGTAQETMERTAGGETREITALTRELLEHTTPPLPVQTVASAKESAVLERGFRVERERHSEETLHTLSPGAEPAAQTEQPLSLTYASTTVELGTAQETMERTGETREITALTRELLERTTPPLPAVQTKAPTAAAATEHLTHRTLRETEADVLAWNEILRETVMQEGTAEWAQQELLPREKTDSTVTDTVYKLRERFAQTIKTPAEGGDAGQSAHLPDGVRLTQLGDTTYLSDQLHTVEETRTETSIPLEIDHPVSDKEAELAVLAQEVAEIERRNRERFAAVQTLRAGQLAQTVATPDLKKIRLDALRALDAADGLELLRETLPPEGTERVQGTRTDAYLAAADAQTRSLFEAVLRYEQNPADPEAERILHPGSVGEFNAVTMELPTGLSGENRESRSRETIRLTRENETLLEQLTETPPSRRSVVRETAPPVSIVYKREQTAFSEELLERWEQERKQVKVSKTSSEEITTRQSSEVVESQVSTQVITQSAEDIQRLVNQTLSKQMSTISDKVYHQMEKRLQTERSRRGRF